MLEPCDAKVSSTVLRGPGDRKVAWLLDRNAKQITCRTRFGVRVFFAFSGMNNADSALYAALKSLGTRDGALTTAFHVFWVVRKVPRIAVLLHPECQDGVHHQRISVSKPRLL